MRSDAIEKAFPGLAAGSYEISSPQNYRYNCIAWATNNDSKWWWPDPQNIGYWPSGVPRKVTLESFISAFESLGFSVCDNQDLEEGYEKIAIFTDSRDIPTHAARQISSGRWTSKLGRLEDIEHELMGVAGSAYGKISVVLRRPI